jgi:hypothetical protein
VRSDWNGQRDCMLGDFDTAGTNVGDHVNLEGQRQHVRVKANLRELRGLLRGLSLLEDSLQGLKGVLDGHDGSVVDGVSHCEGGKVWY